MQISGSSHNLMMLKADCFFPEVKVRVLDDAVLCCVYGFRYLVSWRSGLLSGVYLLGLLLCLGCIWLPEADGTWLMRNTSHGTFGAWVFSKRILNQHESTRASPCTSQLVLESTKVLLEDVPDLGRHPPSLGAVLGGELLPTGPVLHDPWRSKCNAHGGGLQTYSGLARQWWGDEVCVSPPEGWHEGDIETGQRSTKYISKNASFFLGSLMIIYIYICFFSCYVFFGFLISLSPSIFWHDILFLES